MHLSSLFLSLKSTWKDESIDVDHDKSIHLSACLHISNFFLPSLYCGGAKCQECFKYGSNNSLVALVLTDKELQNTMGNCKMIRSHLSAQIQLFCGAAAVTIWVSSGCQMSCYAASFFAGKNKRGEPSGSQRGQHILWVARWCHRLVRHQQNLLIADENFSPVTLSFFHALWCAKDPCLYYPQK